MAQGRMNTELPLPAPFSAARLALRLLLMAALLVGLVILSGPLRSINPLQFRIATNITFFIGLGMADQWLLAPLLDRVPLLRAALIIVETLALGWFFSPASGAKFLFFTHVAPFFVAVFGGALLVAALQRRGRRSP